MSFTFKTNLVMIFKNRKKGESYHMKKFKNICLLVLCYLILCSTFADTVPFENIIGTYGHYEDKIPD